MSDVLMRLDLKTLKSRHHFQTFGSIEEEISAERQTFKTNNLRRYTSAVISNRFTQYVPQAAAKIDDMLLNDPGKRRYVSKKERIRFKDDLRSTIQEAIDNPFLGNSSTVRDLKGYSNLIHGFKSSSGPEDLILRVERMQRKIQNYLLIETDIEKTIAARKRLELYNDRLDEVKNQRPTTRSRSKTHDGNARRKNILGTPMDYGQRSPTRPTNKTPKKDSKRKDEQHEKFLSDAEKILNESKTAENKLEEMLEEDKEKNQYKQSDALNALDAMLTPSITPSMEELD